MKIFKDNPFYFLWEDGYKKGQIKGLQKALELIKISEENRGEFERMIQEEISILVDNND